MKLNNKGFAISTVMYMILILAVILITLTLSTLSSRKLILDKIRRETLNNIYDTNSISFKEAIDILKAEAINYASSNNITKQSIKISDLNSSIDSEILDAHELSNKYLTMVKNENTYDIYLGNSSKITDLSKKIKPFIDIYDYKIYGNSKQEIRSGKNLVDNIKLNSTNVANGKIETNNTGLTVKNSYATVAFAMSDLFEPNTTYYIHCEREYSTTRANATGRIANVGGIGVLLEYNKEDGSFTTGDELTGYLYFYGFVSEGTVEFKNLYIGKTPYTEYEPYWTSPSPEFPSEIQSVGDKTKNLFVDRAELYTRPSNYYILPIKLKQGVTYTMSSQLYGTAITSTTVVGIVKSGDQYSSFDGLQWTLHTGSREKYYTVTFTVDSTWTSPNLVIYVSSGTTVSQVFENYHIQLEEGSTATSYEPYGYKIPMTISNENSSIAANIYLNQPLRKIGDYVDYTDFKNGKVVRNINEIILDENSPWDLYTASNYKGFNAVNALSEKYLRAEGLSNQSNYVGYYYRSQYPNAIWVGVNNRYVYWVFQDDYDGTLEDSGLSNLKARLAITPLVIDYVSNTPTEEAETLSNVPEIGSYNRISVNPTLKPSKIEFTVIHKLKKL